MDELRVEISEEAVVREIMAVAGEIGVVVEECSLEDILETDAAVVWSNRLEGTGLGWLYDQKGFAVVPLWALEREAQELVDGIAASLLTQDNLVLQSC